MIQFDEHIFSNGSPTSVCVFQDLWNMGLFQKKCLFMKFTGLRNLHEGFLGTWSLSWDFTPSFECFFCGFRWDGFTWDELFLQQWWWWLLSLSLSLLLLMMMMIMQLLECFFAEISVQWAKLMPVDHREACHILRPAKSPILTKSQF